MAIDPGDDLVVLAVEVANQHLGRDGPMEQDRIGRLDAIGLQVVLGRQLKQLRLRFVPYEVVSENGEPHAACVHAVQVGETHCFRFNPCNVVREALRQAGDGLA
jgi:hypothetical protein